MRKLSCLFLAGLLSVVYGCSPSVSRKPYFDALEPANVLTLEQDTTLVLVRDFFPSADRVEKTDSPHLKVIPHPGYDTVMVVTREDTPLMTVLNVQIEGQTGHIPVRKKVAFSKKAPRLAVFPPLPDTDALFTLKAEDTPATLYVFWQNSLVQTVHITDSYNVMLPGFTALQDRSWIRAWAVNDHGISNDLLIPLEKGRPVTRSESLERKDKHTLIMYQVFIDRFFNGNPANDRKVNSPEVLPKVDYFGGDLDGVISKIDEGFFKELGVNAIWLSPITQNPYDAWGQIEDPKTRFSGYHGYWPLYITKVDDRFGNDSILTRLIHQAHGNNMNVILDHVANHMHQDAPTLKEHPDWVTSPVTPDGRPNFELWDEFRLTTWFDKHIPKFDFSRPEVCEALSDSALYWLENFNLDGFRHDATKHIDELFWRTLTRKIVTNFPDRAVFQIGETYGSPSLINSYVNKGMLDGQFDFNLYHTFLNSTVNTDGSFVDLWDELQSGLMQYGYHNLMGNISGNHDKARYISLAGGALAMDEDHKLAGWKRNIGTGSHNGYEYLAMLHAFNMTLPGIPCIYYGDEIGMPGANDPDNRRMMVFDGYTPMQIRLKERVKRLTSLRNSNMALLYGDLFPLYVNKDVLAYVRIYMDQVVAVCINKGDDLFDFRSLELPFGMRTDDLVPYMGETMVAPKGFTIMTND
ncbi:MAG TPA: alpha-amylase family glycosyl hydrolase [Bacteroidales bacterium]|nr:alpha-amylase family glycosyl hydrolase [Bacteroidales bacterium]HRW95345.1 alpha-amylase family glycosyl hydrolase [Bacteroidales bacterium]